MHRESVTQALLGTALLFKKTGFHLGDLSPR